MGINEFINIGSKIKQKRIEMGISQKDMAFKIDIPVSTYSNYENNYREPNGRILSRILSALDTNLKELLNDDDEIHRIINNINQGNDSNGLSKKLQALCTLMDSIDYTLEYMNDEYTIFNRVLGGLIVTEQELNQLEKDLIDYLEFSIEKIYKNRTES
jgi:transcriptional regulator with XRE-family HTH domain